MPRNILAVAGVLALVVAGLAAYLDRPAPPAAERPDAETPAAPKADPVTGAFEPQKFALYCEFYVFVESRPFVAFLLEQTREDRRLYRQVYVAKADGDRTDYNVLAGRQPEWRFETDAGPRLDSRVTVPDTSQAGLGEEDIAIEMRDFDPERSDGVWREASLKSVYYQNLPGKCRHAKT